MDKNKQEQKKKKAEAAIQSKNIENTIKELNSYICSAQTDLLKKCQEIILAQKEMEITLPTVFHQVIKDNGMSEMQKVSEIKMPFGYLLSPGIFQINNVDVELPINIESISKPKEAAKENGNNSTVTLRLSYEYQKLSQVTDPVVIKHNPIIDLVFKEFKIDPINQKKCSAKGILKVLDEKTGKPMYNDQVFLSIDEGNIIPSVANLDKEGIIEFVLIGNCQEEKKFSGDIIVVINGRKRTFNVALTQ